MNNKGEIRMEDCLFCNKKDYVLENDYAYAIFDEFPVSLGHMLIIPKEHIQDFLIANQDKIGRAHV